MVRWRKRKDKGPKNLINYGALVNDPETARRLEKALADEAPSLTEMYDAARRRHEAEERRRAALDPPEYDGPRGRDDGLWHL